MPKSASELIQATIESLDKPQSWDLFFNKFIEFVHPAEFAIEDKSTGQLENAISSPTQYVLRDLLSDLGHCSVATALETPTRISKKRTVYADVTIFPWLIEKDLRSHWIIAKNKENHINIEIKWRVQGSIGSKKIISLLGQNTETNPTYTLIFLFHQNQELVKRFTTTLASNKEIIYAKSKPRKSQELCYPNPFMSLIVVRSKQSLNIVQSS